MIRVDLLHVNENTIKTSEYFLQTVVEFFGNPCAVEIMTRYLFEIQSTPLNEIRK